MLVFLLTVHCFFVENEIIVLSVFCADRIYVNTMLLVLTAFVSKDHGLLVYFCHFKLIYFLSLLCFFIC